MIQWLWPIIFFVAGFFTGALLIRYKGNKDMEALAKEVKDIETKIKEMEENLIESKTRSN